VGRHNSTWQNTIGCCRRKSDRYTLVSLAARCLGSNIGRIAGRLGLMLCSRSLLWTVLELIGRNPGMLLAVRLHVSYTSEKQFCLNDINSSVMPCHDENQRLRAIGMFQAGLAQNVVARHFGCHRNTILSLWRRFRQSGNTRDRVDVHRMLAQSCILNLK
jgi:hypothetical protein